MVPNENGVHRRAGLVGRHALSLQFVVSDLKRELRRRVGADPGGPAGVTTKTFPLQHVKGNLKKSVQRSADNLRGPSPRPRHLVQPRKIFLLGTLDRLAKFFVDDKLQPKRFKEDVVAQVRFYSVFTFPRSRERRRSRGRFLRPGSRFSWRPPRRRPPGASRRPRPPRRARSGSRPVRFSKRRG